MTKVRLIPLIAIVFLVSTSNFAVAQSQKNMTIELQTKVDVLLDTINKLQLSNAASMGVLKDLVQQNSDSVNRMSVAIDAMQKQLSAQQAAEGAKVDTVSGQVQSLNDSLDEIKARMNRLEKTLNEVSSQQQTILPILQNLPQTSSPGNGASQPGSQPAPQAIAPAGPAPMTQSASVNNPPSAVTAAAPITRRSNGAATAAAAAPVEDIYKAAFSDFMAARYNVATAEFGDVIKSYPDSPLSGNSYFYLGEIDYRAAKYSAAAKDYDKLLEQYPGNNKIPAAHLHKGQALIEMREKDAGVREFRALIQRFPNSPEATQARSKMNAMGVPIKPRT